MGLFLSFKPKPHQPVATDKLLGFMWWIVNISKHEYLYCLTTFCIYVQFLDISLCVMYDLQYDKIHQCTVNHIYDLVINTIMKYAAWQKNCLSVFYCQAT